MSRQRRGLAATLAGLALCAAACSERPAPTPQRPTGALLVAQRPGLARLLDQLARLDGTPLARRARELGAALPACDVLEAHAPDGDAGELLAGLRCRPTPSELAFLHDERGARDLVFELPLRDGGRLRGALTWREPGDVELELHVPESLATGARALLMPGREAAGPGVLSGEGSLVHVRLRPQGGLDLASLIPAGGQADRLFRLRSQLFSGAVLDGTWEAAVYLPDPAGGMPRAALALGFSRRAPAVAAVEKFLREIQAAWPVRRSFFAVGEASGACLLDLAVLPELAPCYVAAEQALVIGWNPASVRKALEAAAPAELSGPGGAIVELARFAEADVLLPQGGRVPARRWPWRRLRADGRRDGTGVRVLLQLDAADGA